jgi:hypothetical protein
MLIAFWIVAAILALAVIGTGMLKLVRSKPALRRLGLTWTDDFPQPVIRLIGVAELVGAAGVVLPMATGIAPVVSSIAAVCLAVLMTGAIATHVRRRENFAPSAVTLVLAIATAVLGFAVLAG